MSPETYGFYFSSPDSKPNVWCSGGHAQNKVEGLPSQILRVNNFYQVTAGYCCHCGINSKL